MIIDEYTLTIPKIGEGSYGEVYLTTKKNVKELYATKKVEKQKIMGEKLRQYFMNEIEILKNLNHQNIMKLIDVKTTHNHIFLITEYCNGGTLSENLSSYQKLHKTPFPEKIVIHLMKQLSDAIYYLHDKHIIHRDLKMENILLHFENLDDRKKLNLMQAKVKIIDFGFARYLNNNSISSSIVGSPLNMAPDILHALTDPKWRGNLKYNEKADIYSIGVFMFYILIGKPPFNAGDCNDLYKRVNDGIYAIPKDLKLSKQCINLMNGMLMQDSDKRFSIYEILKSDFLTKAYETFEMIDFSDLDNESNNNKNLKKNNLQHNENIIFLDIKEMINLENKQQLQLKENNENLNVVINDMNNRDQELEDLLEQLKKEKVCDSLKYQPKPNEKSNNIVPIMDYQSFDNQKNYGSNKQINLQKDEDLIKIDKNKINANSEISKNNVNVVKDKNLINLNEYENIQINFEEDKNKKNSNKNLINFPKDEVNFKKIYDFPLQELDNIFDMMNKKFEMFEMEAIPMYLENPEKYENFIL